MTDMADTKITTKLGEYLVKSVAEGKLPIHAVGNATEWAKVRPEVRKGSDPKIKIVSFDLLAIQKSEMRQKSKQRSGYWITI